MYTAAGAIQNYVWIWRLNLLIAYAKRDDDAAFGGSSHTLLEIKKERERFHISTDVFSHPGRPRATIKQPRRVHRGKKGCWWSVENRRRLFGAVKDEITHQEPSVFGCVRHAYCVFVVVVVIVLFFMLLWLNLQRNIFFLSTAEIAALVNHPNGAFSFLLLESSVRRTFFRFPRARKFLFGFFFPVYCICNRGRLEGKA